MPSVIASFFGTFNLTINGTPITKFRSNKVRALFAYLLLTQPQPLLRSAVRELLWADYTEQSAHANLRQTLTNLRACLAPFDLIQSNRTHISLQSDPATLWCDVQHFEALLDACARHEHRALTGCEACQARLQEAVALYQAPFLKTFPTTDSPPFNRWLQQHREWLATRLAEAQAAIAAAALAGNLPPPLTPLVGRSHELAELAHSLQHAVYRCVSLVGPGGIGKTRLALALGAQMQVHFPNGVWLVELSGLAPTTPAEPPEQLYDRLATAIATALHLPFYGSTRPADQVTNYLAGRALLLILDSFEHLAAGAAWLPALLTAAPRLRLLITTRQRLPLQSQLVYLVKGLGVPPVAVTDTPSASHLLAQYAGLQLFVERAQSAGLPLALNQETLTTVGQLCHFVEGSPWAIEVAVALLDHQQPAAILTAIQQNYRTLTSDRLDVPLRQRSAEAVFLTSWRLLTPVEAQTLARCAVFRGGFTLAAAQAIAAATPITLEALVQKSLLRPNGADRYALHDLVRQFAGEQLQHDAEAAHQSAVAHTAYFMALLATWQPDDATLHHFRAAVTQDWENVQAAWAWALATGQVALLQQGLEGLAEYYNLVELVLEADATLGNAIVQLRRLLTNTNDALAAPTADRRAQQTLLAHLLWRHCYFVNDALSETTRGAPMAQELLTLAQDLGDDALVARAYYELSIVAYFQRDTQKQEELLYQALALAQQSGTRYDQIVCLNMLGNARSRQSDLGAALAYYRQALALTQAGNYVLYDLMVRNNIGSLLVSDGQFSAALANFQQGLSRAIQGDFKGKIAFIMASLGEIAYLVGDYAEARSRLVEAQQRYADLHDPVVESEILTMLAALFAEQADDAAALAYCQRALAAAGGQRYTVQHSALCTLGYLYRRQEQWDVAADVYQQALTLSQTVQWATDEVRCQTYLAAVRLGQGDVAAAQTMVEPLLTNFATTPFTPQQRPQELRLIAYQILVANADPRAPLILQQAWQLVQAQLTQIDDPRLRHTFLTNVPVNRELARLVG